MARDDDFADDLTLAFELGVLASEVALPLFRAGVTPRPKPDGSVVTDGDYAVEQRLLEVLAQRRPADAVLSEESGAIGSARRRWVLDPIDGTSYFASRRDSWGTHIALEVEGSVVLGVVTRPVHGQHYWGIRGGGAFRGALGSGTPLERLQVSTATELERARVMVWSHRGDPLIERVRARCAPVAPTLDGLLDVASGRIDALVDRISFAWDLAPAVVIVEEAGGLFVDLEGGRNIETGGGWFSNGRLGKALQGLETASPS